jgi:hypothetical protein
MPAGTISSLPAAISDTIPGFSGVVCMACLLVSVHVPTHFAAIRRGKPRTAARTRAVSAVSATTDRLPD